MNKLILICMLVLASFCAVPSLVHAQDETDDFPDDLGETDVPFDGGISLLVIAGVAYGIKMRQDKKD